MDQVIANALSAKDAPIKFLTSASFILTSVPDVPPASTCKSLTNLSLPMLAFSNSLTFA